jgi:hypothetical protein
MSDEQKLSRREAIKSITIGTGVVATLPVLGGKAIGQDHQPSHEHVHGAQTATNSTPHKLKFFDEDENKTIIELSELIIPADDSSPGAKAALVNEYIDLIVNESPSAVKQNWRDGLAAVNRKSSEMFAKRFVDASVDQRIKLLTEISKNERNPGTVEEKFFRIMKNATIDGYYTSEIGIHKELHYKGNSYLKEFVGCTHPEHQG